MVVRQLAAGAVVVRQLAAWAEVVRELRSRHIGHLNGKESRITLRKTRSEWRSKWGVFGWANGRHGARWLRKEKPRS